MGVRIIGSDGATKYLEALRVERDAYNGKIRILDMGKVKLDSVKAWDGTSDHKSDGSTIEIVYKAYKPATKRQIQEASGAKAAGVHLRKIEGRLVDLRENEDGTTLVLVTTGLRHSQGDKPAFRAMNIQKGAVLGIAIDDSLGMTAEQVEALHNQGSSLGQTIAKNQATPSQEVQTVGDDDDLCNLDAGTDFDNAVDVTDRDTPLGDAWDEAIKMNKAGGTVKVMASEGEVVNADSLDELAKNLVKLNKELDDGAIHKKVKNLVHIEVKRQLEVIVQGLQDIIVNMKDPSRKMPELTEAQLKQLGGFEPKEDK